MRMTFPLLKTLRMNHTKYLVSQKIIRGLYVMEAIYKAYVLPALQVDVVTNTSQAHNPSKMHPVRSL